MERFEAAVAAAPGFTDALVWAGRTALELERPDAAAGYWRQVVEVRPDDAGAAWFLGVAQTQSRWGVAAGRAYWERRWPAGGGR